MNMKKFITSLLFLCLLAGVSFADIAYNTSNGMLGLISISALDEVSPPVVKYSNAGNDSLLATYANTSYANLLLLKRSYDTATSLGDNALIFDTLDMTAPIDDFILEGVYDSVKVGYSFNGTSVFVASQSGSTITEYDSSTFAYLNSCSIDIDGVVEDMLVDRAYIYLLMTAVESPDIGVLLRFDGQLRIDTKAFAMLELPEGSKCMATLGNLFTAIGHSTGIIALNNRTLQGIVDTAEPVKAVCMDYNTDNFGCYYITQSENNGNYTNSLWHFNGLTAELLNTQQSSNSHCKLIYDYENGIMAAIMAEKIFIYSSTGDALLATFDSAALGGTPENVAITTVITSTNYSSKSNRSGCNITGAGLVLFILAALKLRSGKF